MLDNEGRIKIVKEIFDRQDKIFPQQEVLLFLDHHNNEIIIEPKGEIINNGLHFVRNASIDSKGRIIVQKQIRKVFQNANFMPAEKNGKIYILIIDHAKKSE